MSKYNELINKAKQLYNQGNLEASANYYEEAFKEKIIVADYLMLGYIYIDLGKLSKAESMFNYMASVDEGIEINYGLANIYERSGRRQESIEMYTKVIEEKNDFEMAHFSIAYLYDEIAEEEHLEYEHETVQKAIKHYEEALKQNQNNFWAHINVGSIYERYNFNDKALYHFTKAYEIDPNEKMVCYNMGVIHFKLKEYDLAKKYYLEELKKQEPFPSTYYNLGILFKDAYHDYKSAKYYYLRGLELNNEDYNIWYNLGCVHALNNDFENAFACFKYIYYKNKKFLNYLDTDPELEDFRGSEYYRQLKEGL